MDGAPSAMFRPAESGYVYGSSQGSPSPTKATGAVPVPPSKVIRQINVTRVAPNPANRRGDVGDVSELAASVRLHGILQPLIAEQQPGGRYLLIAGHRRLAAAKLAGLETVPVDVKAGTAGPAKTTVLMLVENCHREDLTAIEKAEAFGQLRDEQGWSVAGISRATGFGPSTVSRYLALLDLDDDSRQRVADGVVRVGQALDAVRDARAELRRSPAPRPGRQVKPRPRARAEAPWFTRQHPLASAAADACSHLNRPKVGGAACGACWEAAIRADERTRAAAS